MAAQPRDLGDYAQDPRILTQDGSHITVTTGAVVKTKTEVLARDSADDVTSHRTVVEALKHLLGEPTTHLAYALQRAFTRADRESMLRDLRTNGVSPIRGTSLTPWDQLDTDLARSLKET